MVVFCVPASVEFWVREVCFCCLVVVVKNVLGVGIETLETSVVAEGRWGSADSERIDCLRGQ